ncbi:hypothetical protein PILCRDRAFT_733565 [Piloderma croceum F 1598]|uniref:Uncharacterized protein n=1 Tax=Piloderma croceum (strain F 1598) TaxID=765440 RepID=A0A0C3EZK9_PILCF|nr:hypothetical protein PILCRDRAFT_733565 [Piloderma croceum F 1598]
MKGCTWASAKASTSIFTPSSKTNHSKTVLIHVKLVFLKRFLVKSVPKHQACACWLVRHHEWLTLPCSRSLLLRRADVDANDNSTSRRPSLPHMYDGLPVPSGSKRPQSAGQDAEP